MPELDPPIPESKTVLLLRLKAELSDDKLTADWVAGVIAKTSGARLIEYFGLLVFVRVPRVIAYEPTLVPV